jgi:hypothetical protein
MFLFVDADRKPTVIDRELMSICCAKIDVDINAAREVFLFVLENDLSLHQAMYIVNEY